MSLNEEVEFKIPSLPTHNRCGSSLLQGASNPGGHQSVSGIKGEVPALTFDPEREDSN